MVRNKTAKVTSLVIGILIIAIAFLSSYFDIPSFGIYAGCEWYGRLAYPFFHANILHAILNVWCLLSLVFIYDISIWRMLFAYVVAISIPVDSLANAIAMMNAPTVGLSGVVYVLFASISFEVVRKWYYQAWMAFYIGVGFLFPYTNAWLHLYCYIVGFGYALLNRPIKIKTRDT